LTWADGARRSVLGELAAFQAAVVVGHIPFTGAKLDPRAINPYPWPRAVAGAGEVDRWHKRRAWRAAVNALRRGKKE
jgi:hypothetical protein